MTATAANTDGSGVTRFIPTEVLGKLGILLLKLRQQIAFDSPVVFLTTGGNCIVRIAYDWIGGNIYYTSGGADRIGLCNVASKLCTVILRSTDGVVGSPIPIALHPKMGRLFWGNTNLRGTGSIYSAAMDGSNPVQLAGTGIIRPNGIAIDAENSRIYWADSSGNKLESCTLNDATGTDTLLRA